MLEYQLKDREKAILRFVIHQFILTANPVGSRNISKKYDIGLSPASIRNIMSDLEESGFLNHPHTSAGRVPTDKGYRFYVDLLMDPPKLEKSAKKIIDENFATGLNQTEELLKITSSILSDLTNQLALVTYPRFEQAVLKKIQIVQLSSTRIMVVVSVQSGLVKTITLEIDAEVQEDQIATVQQFLNEKLTGLRFSEIRSSLEDRVKDFDSGKYQPIIRVFLDSVDKIFTDTSSEKVIISGTKNILKQPEFEDLSNFQSVIELIENKDIIIHILDEKKLPVEDDVSISIGQEIKEEKLSDYSMISKEYKIGDQYGTLGIMGPKRMDYSKIVAAVVYIAEQLTQELTKQR
ncbi:MAG: heat-inducible transcription repressor HrcA [Ignavibacteriae bacterium HGW-Ignavibacteriae-3]|nr:MAG: heat-inducible transcription repressor HrcA [Ignavibacteriae bacterium HGW-Ignavibacteriae-3]